MSVNYYELVLGKTSVLSKSELKHVAIGNDGDYVIVLHDYLRSANSMNKICKFLDEKNFIVFNCNYPSTKYSIEILANKLLKEFINKFCTNKSKKIHFIGHSLGGVIIYKFLQDNPLLNIGKFIMINPVNNGAYWADIFSKLPLSKHIFGPCLIELSTAKGSLVNKLKNNDSIDIGVICAKYDWMTPKGNGVLSCSKDIVELNSTAYTILSNKSVPKLIYNFILSSFFDRPFK